MDEEIDYYEARLQVLYNRRDHANDLIDELTDSKELIQEKIDEYFLPRLENENRLIAEENEALQFRISQTHKSISTLKQSPESRSMNQHIRKSLTFTAPVFSEESKSSIESQDEDIIHQISNDPNVEKFLGQISELKELCKIQKEVLERFCKTMESAKGENERLQQVIAEIENDKKGLSDILATSAIRSSSAFENEQGARRSFEESMFISTLDGMEKESNGRNERGSRFRKKGNFLEIALLSSNISSLHI
jgi:hypothetical protein